MTFSRGSGKAGQEMIRLSRRKATQQERRHVRPGASPAAGNVADRPGRPGRYRRADRPLPRTFSMETPMAKHESTARGYCARCGELFPCTKWRLRQQRARERNAEAASAPTVQREPRFTMPAAPDATGRIRIDPDALADLRASLEPAEREAWRRVWED